MATGKSILGVFFKRGLRALLPTVLTIGVIVIVYNFFADSIVEPVNRGIRTFSHGRGLGASPVRVVKSHSRRSRAPTPLSSGGVRAT